MSRLGLPRRGRLVPVTVVALAVLAVLTSCGSPAHGTRTARSQASQDPAHDFRSLDSTADVSLPVRLRIPAIGVDAPVRSLGLMPDGSLQVPQRWGDVGWYAGGPRPGEPGPAILLGHVDSTAGPAVFFRLRALRKGQQVQVVRADGSVARFAVTRLARYAKSSFPADEVYLPTLDAELRLVTCTGRFNAGTGHYVDNLVAYAARVG